MNPGIKHILIADDQPHVIRVLKLTLEREGYEIDSVGNGAAALERIRQRAPDVLITDIQMPLMSGHELCCAIRAEFPQRTFPIFVMTSMTERDNWRWSSEIGNTRLLEKPLSPRNLVKELAGLAIAPHRDGMPA